ncbi:hypothetical protein MCOR15_002195 [Pyricularia oryzae]|nr:hypothetical protein MCOR15_002195 [Pyricularia oryzae]
MSETGTVGQVLLGLKVKGQTWYAGGGGKTPYRNEKIRAKNDKLREERARRMKAELEAKHKEDEQDGIHPSRRAQMHRSQHADAQ